MTRTVVTGLLLAVCLLSAPLTANPFIEYQDVVVVEPYPGGGGGAMCHLELTIRVYANGNTTEISRRTVCL